MKNSLLEISGHLSNETISLLKRGKLTTEESIDALAHIGECSVCADYFAQCFSENDLLAVPDDFTQRVLKEAAALPALKAPANGGGRTLREFYLYTARVSIAMCLTLMLIFSGFFNTAANAIEVGAASDISFTKVDAFNEDVRGITDKIASFEINKLEVLKNDQKKK